MGLGGRFGTCPSSSSPDSSSDEPGDSDGGSWVESREKSSMDAGPEGEVMLSPEMSGDMVALLLARCIAWSGCSVAGVALALALGAFLSAVFKDRNVGKFGVDLDWKPVGTAVDLGGVPLLCGGIVWLSVVHPTELSP